MKFRTTNKFKGSVRCGTLRECENDWWKGTSDDQECLNFDPDIDHYRHLKCTFCCTADNCNKDVVPVRETLFRPTETDGGWSDWSAWSLCSASCGNGSRSKSRTCDNPAPQNGGLPCVGDSITNEDCNIKSCPGKMQNSHIDKVARHDKTCINDIQ